MTADRRAALPVDQVANLIRIYKDRWSAGDLAERIFDLIRAETLEEAAGVADAEASIEGIAQRIAAAIRALKEAPCSSS